MQGINEILKNLNAPKNTPAANMESILWQGKETTRFVWPSGMCYYRDLGIWTDPGEDLKTYYARRKQEQIEEGLRSRAQHIGRIFGEAQIPTRFQGWSFETFPVDNEKQKAFDEAKLYASLQGTTSSLFVLGEYGVGKTSLAISILKARIGQGVPSLYVAVPDLLDKIRATFNGHGDYTELMEAVQRIDFLVMDDLGSEYPTAWAKEKMYQLIGYRHAWELPMVGTSNLTPRELETQVGERVLWRMFEMGMVVWLKGRNLRKRR